MYRKEYLLPLQIQYLEELLVELQFQLVLMQGDSLHKQFDLLLHEDSDMHFVQKQDMRRKLLVKKIVPTIPKITNADLNFLIA